MNVPPAGAGHSDSSETVSRTYRYTVLVMLLLVYIISYVDRQIVGILAIPIKAELQLTDSQLGLMGGFAFAIFYTGLGIPIARLADRFNRAWIIGTSLAIWSIFTALCGMANQFVTLFMARIGVGVGEAGGVAPSYALLSDYFPPHQRGRILGIYSLGVPLGSAAGLVVGGYIGQYYGWRAAFLFLGALGLLLVPVFLFVVREAPRGRFDGSSSTAEQPSLGDTLSHLRRQPVFWLASIATGFGAMMSYGLTFWLPAYLQRSLHLDLTETAQLLGLTTLIGGSISMVGSGWLADRMSVRNRRSYALIPFWTTIASLLCLLAALSMNSIPIVMGLLLATQIFSQAYAPPSIALVQSLSPAAMRATTSAIFLLILNLMGVGLGPFLFGAVSDYFIASYGAEALRFAIISCATVCYSLAALLFLLEARRL